MAISDFYQPHARVQANNELVNGVTGEITNPPSMTKQEFVKECDINNIIKMYSVTGQINHISAKAALGAYDDLPDSLDFQESLNTVMAAEAAFMSLPSKTRERFHNEPSEFLEFFSDPKNRAEATSLGLLIPQPPPAAAIGGETGGTPPPSPSSESPKSEPTA